MQNGLDKKKITSAIRNLGVIERLNIVTEIWDEIKESKELEAVSDEEKRLLLNRLANYRENPNSAIDWTELKHESYSRYDKKG